MLSTPHEATLKAPFASDMKRVRLALARQAYRDGRIRLVDGDLTGCDCLVSSRQGLWACSRTEARAVAHGMFFGMALHDGALYLFESGDRPRYRSLMGRIVRLRLRDGHLGEPDILVTGLECNCHQIAVIDGLLCVVETPNQVVRRFTLHGDPVDVRAPFPVAQPSDATGAYLHMNSIATVGDKIGLILHNGAGESLRPSQFALLDATWNLVECHELAGHKCHDILPYPDGSLLFCGSFAGEIISLDGRRIKVCDQMTRGLAMSATAIMVGETPLLERGGRDAAAGRVHFLDHALSLEAAIDVPGAPTVILAL